MKSNMFIESTVIVCVSVLHTVYFGILKEGKVGTFRIQWPGYMYQYNYECVP